MIRTTYTALIVLLLLGSCGVPAPTPLSDSPVPWDQLFPPADNVDADQTGDADAASVDPDAELLPWPPEGVEPLTNSCAQGEQRRVGGTVSYDGPEIPVGASLYLLLDSSEVPPPGIPECFQGVVNPVFPVTFEFQEVWHGEPRYVMALLKWDGSFPPIPGPDDWFARFPIDGPLPMDEDVFWLELSLAPYQEE